MLIQVKADNDTFQSMDALKALYRSCLYVG